MQDISKDMLAQAQSRDMSDLQERVTFQQHNFFEPQQAHDASAFFIRQCIHNWNDRDCIKILRAFVPALQECELGTPLLINDTILPEPGSKTQFEEHDLRQLDIAMLVIVGAKQRTEKDFRKLLKEADDRFVVTFHP